MTRGVPSTPADLEDIIPAGGATGQVLAKASNADFDTAWVAGGGGADLIGCIVRKNVPQSIPNNTPTDITFDVADYDPHGFFDVETGRVTVPQAFGGWYSMSLQLSFEANAVGFRRVQFENSQGFDTPSSQKDAAASGNTDIPMGHVAPLSFEEDDYIIPRASQTSGDLLNIGEGWLFLVRTGGYELP